jgi:1,2-diacylglycerol 3-alpha-glucosyltransferase
MRIGFVSTYPPIECGIATYTESLNLALRSLENETFVMSQFGAQGEQVFPIYHPDQPFASNLFATSTRMTPDVVHIQHEYGLFGPQRGVEVIDLMLRYRLANIPVVVTLHTVYTELKREEVMILRHIVEDSAAIIVHEEFQKKTLVDNFGAEQKIHVIEHGVRDMAPISDAKKKLELDGKKVIMLCGYFRKTKGFHRALDFFPEICANNPDAVLVVAGKIRGIEAQDYQEQLFTQLNNSPVADRIVFLRGQFPQHTFDTILSAADVMVMPYEVGAQSGMMAQCFAMNCPVVASDLPAFKLLINRSGGGVICKTDEDYVQAISNLINDPGEHKKIRDNISTYVTDRASWSNISQKHIEVYHSVVTVPYGKARYVYFPEED